MAKRRRAKAPEYVADFETTTVPDDCRVWGWGMASIDVDPDTELGTDIDEFMEFISDRDSGVYFHNLAFDSAFIMDWLFRQGYKHTTDQLVSPGEFSTLISSMGQFYQMRVKWENGKSTVFKDSLKKLPMSVSNVAKAFELVEGKGDIDYHLDRPVGYKPTKQEWDYIRRDVEIIARALHKQITAGMTKLTVGADSLADYKETIPKKTWDRTFPVLPLPMDTTIRGAYKGGFTYADSRTQGERVGPGRAYDVNSLYPYVMRAMRLPYGVPQWYDGAPRPTIDMPLFTLSADVIFKLKKDHIPCIQIKSHPAFKGTEYLTEVSEPTTVNITNVDLELWQEHYDFEILTYNGGYMFHATSGLFDKYIDKWMAVKANSTGGMRLISKLFLNSLYGKFATNPDITGKIPVFDEEVNHVRLVMGEAEDREPVYTAMGAFITAYARALTIRAAQANYGRFLYADTDSLHLSGLGEPEGLTVDPHALGAWKHEYDFEEGVFLKAKQYGERLMDGSHAIHIAGMPRNVAEGLTLDDLTAGRKFGGKLIPKRVPGGIVLTDTHFTL